MAERTTNTSHPHAHATASDKEKGGFWFPVVTVTPEGSYVPIARRSATPRLIQNSGGNEPDLISHSVTKEGRSLLPDLNGYK